MQNLRDIMKLRISIIMKKAQMIIRKIIHKIQEVIDFNQIINQKTFYIYYIDFYGGVKQV